MFYTDSMLECSVLIGASEENWTFASFEMEKKCTKKVADDKTECAIIQGKNAWDISNKSNFISTFVLKSFSSYWPQEKKSNI